MACWLAATRHYIGQRWISARNVQAIILYNDSENHTFELPPYLPVDNKIT